MKRTMPQLAMIALLVGTAACSQREEGTQGIAAEESEPSSPDIAPSAAPGVAFAYGYNFKLADERVSGLQETHASECERLGLARCRITGLRYTVGENEQVSAMLQVKLDPAIARQFGKNAVASTEKAGGRLVNAEFSGDDEGSSIRTATTQKTELETRIADIERRLSTLRPGDRERTQLQQQLDQLRQELTESKRQISASEEKLATTPMTFNYYGKGGVPGFGGENPIAEAWRLLVASTVTMISLLLKFVGAVLPWAALILLLVMLVRSRVGRAIRRWWTSIGDKDPPEA